jgi:hypothetical protein
VDNSGEAKDGEANVAVVEDGHNDDDVAMDDGDEAAVAVEPNTNSEVQQQQEQHFVVKFLLHAAVEDTKKTNPPEYHVHPTRIPPWKNNHSPQ